MTVPVTGQSFSVMFDVFCFIHHKRYKFKIALKLNDVSAFKTFCIALPSGYCPECDPHSERRNRLHIRPKIMDNTPHTINLPVNNRLKEIGTVKIFFNVSSVCSREIIYPAIKLMHIGKIMDILFLITCSIR